MQKALVTGYRGFIGSNLVKRLKKDGVQLFLLEKEDVLDKPITEVVDIMSEVDAVFHVGAISNTDAQNINEVMTYNVLYSQILLYALMRQNKDTPFIFSSSASIYGKDGGTVDIDAASRVKLRVSGIPSNLYAWSKYAFEAGVCYENFISLRYFNVYGPGECHKGKMASVANQAYKQQKNGKSFELFNTVVKRDFIHVDDVVEANLAAYKYSQDVKFDKNIFDVGTGESRSFESMLDLMGLSYHYGNKIIPEWYQHKTQANKNDFVPGWQPKVSLEEGCRLYKKWLDENIK